MPGDSGLTDTHAFRYHRISLPTVLQCPTLQAEDSPRTRTRSCLLRDCRYALIRSQGHSKRLRPGVLDAGIPYVHAIALSVFAKLRRRSAVCGYLGSEFDKGHACRLVVALSPSGSQNDIFQDPRIVSSGSPGSPKGALRVHAVTWSRHPIRIELSALMYEHGTLETA
jgi:hypothetical protein